MHMLHIAIEVVALDLQTSAFNPSNAEATFVQDTKDFCESAKPCHVG